MHMYVFTLIQRMKYKVLGTKNLICWNKVIQVIITARFLFVLSKISAVNMWIKILLML